MGLQADLAHAAAGVVNPLVSGIDSSASPKTAMMLTNEMGGLDNNRVFGR